MPLEDYDTIANLVVEKLKATNREDRDKEFIQKIVAEMIKHRAPCHDLTEKDITDMRSVIRKAKRFDHGFFWIIITIAGLALKTAWDFLTTNIHWAK